MKLPSLVPQLADSLVHLLFPRLCAGCRIPLIRQEEVLCMSCVTAMPVTGFCDHPDNEAAMRLAGRIPYLHATAYAYFSPDGLLQHLLHLLKYGGRKDIGTFLGTQAGIALRGAACMEGVDCILPVPLHPKKEAARGYNQTALIAGGLGDTCSLPVLGRALQRRRATESQTSKSREERERNVAGAFICRAGGALSGRHLLLVDDVLTTGATLEAASAPLLPIPGLKLSILTIGVAMS